jgi:hypothetical protein
MLEVDSVATDRYSGPEIKTPFSPIWVVLGEITMLASSRAGQYSPANRSDSFSDLNPQRSRTATLFDADSVAISQAIDNAFRAVPIEVVFRTSDAHSCLHPLL